MNSTGTSPKPDKSVSFKRNNSSVNTKYNKRKSDIELIHENIDLREQLKSLNSKLNEILETKSRKTKKLGQMASPKSILMIAKKQLGHYK